MRFDQYPGALFKDGPVQAEFVPAAMFDPVLKSAEKVGICAMPPDRRDDRAGILAAIPLIIRRAHGLHSARAALA